jgi:hypothetical protein
MPIGGSVNDAWQVRIVGEIEGQETNNILHFSNATADADVETHLILVLAACFITHLLPVSSSAWKLVKLVWKRVFPTLSNEFTTIPTGTLVGGGSAAALPSYASVVLSLRTLQGGKSHRGRMYLPGVPESATLVSSLDTSNAYWTAVLAFANCLVTNFGVGDPPGGDQYQLQIYSRKLGGSTFPYGNAGFTPVSAINAVQQLGTTRSRKVGRGS